MISRLRFDSWPSSMRAFRTKSAWNSNSTRFPGESHVHGARRHITHPQDGDRRHRSASKHVASGAQHVMTTTPTNKLSGNSKSSPEAPSTSVRCRFLYRRSAFPTSDAPSVRSLSFQIPTLCASALCVRYLQVIDDASTSRHRDAPPRNPHRWIRYLTKSSSYVVRV